MLFQQSLVFVPLFNCENKVVATKLLSAWYYLADVHSNFVEAIYKNCLVWTLRFRNNTDSFGLLHQKRIAKSLIICKKKILISASESQLFFRSVYRMSAKKSILNVFYLVSKKSKAEGEMCINLNFTLCLLKLICKFQPIFKGC